VWTNRLGVRDAFAAASATLLAIGGLFWWRHRQEVLKRSAVPGSCSALVEAAHLPVATKLTLPASAETPKPALPSAGSAELWRTLVAPKSEWNPDAFLAALQSDPDAHRVCDTSGRTPLAFAAQQNRGFAARHLLVARADANARGPRGWTALHYCSMDGRDIELLSLLVGARADPNVLTADGMPALFYATNAGHDAAVAALIKSGAQRDAVKQTARRHGGACIGD